MKKEAELRQFPERIVMKFCTMVGLPDVVTRAKLDGDRFGHFFWWRVEFQVFPLLVVLTTLWHGMKVFITK